MSSCCDAGSHVAYDGQMVRFLDAFLSLSPRVYEEADGNDALLPTEAAATQAVRRRVLQLYLRLVAAEDRGAVLAPGEAATKAYASFLWQRRILDLPKVRERESDPVKRLVC